MRVESSGLARGLANARPPGSATLANVPPPGLTRRANAPQLSGAGGWAQVELTDALLPFWGLRYFAKRNETKRNGTLRNGTLRNGTLRNGYTSANAPKFFALATKSCKLAT